MSWSKQDVLLGGSKAWVLPNPSGLIGSFGLDVWFSLIPSFALHLTVYPSRRAATRVERGGVLPLNDEATDSGTTSNSQTSSV